jgi:hypothetical protein
MDAKQTDTDPAQLWVLALAWIALIAAPDLEYPAMIPWLRLSRLGWPVTTVILRSR